MLALNAKDWKVSGRDGGYIKLTHKMFDEMYLVKSVKVLFKGNTAVTFKHDFSDAQWMKALKELES